MRGVEREQQLYVVVEPKNLESEIFLQGVVHADRDSIFVGEFVELKGSGVDGDLEATCCLVGLFLDGIDFLVGALDFVGCARLSRFWFTAGRGGLAASPVPAGLGPLRAGVQPERSFQAQELQGVCAG